MLWLADELAWRAAESRNACIFPASVHVSLSPPAAAPCQLTPQVVTMSPSFQRHLFHEDTVFVAFQNRGKKWKHYFRRPQCIPHTPKETTKNVGCLFLKPLSVYV